MTSKTCQYTTLVTALRVAKRYPDSVPTHTQLMNEFGFSRATAYRWAKSIRDERARQ